MEEGQQEDQDLYNIEHKIVSISHNFHVISWLDSFHSQTLKVQPVEAAIMTQSRESGVGGGRGGNGGRAVGGR